MNVNLLIQYQSIQQEMRELKERADRIYQSSLFPRGSQLTGMPRPAGYSNDGMIRIFEKIEELTELYHEKLSQLTTLCVEIEKEIADLPSLERRVIRLRYLEGKGWSEIRKRTGLSESTLHRLHRKLIKVDAPRHMLS